MRDRLTDAEADAAPMNWDDFHAMARKYDQEQDLYEAVNRRPKSNELKALTGNPMTGSRTRSGKTDGAVNALDANPDHRGRSTEQYTPRSRDASRPRSNSAGSNRDAPMQRSNSWKSNGSRQPSRERQPGSGRPWQDNPPKSPRTGPPGSTPHSKDFKKTPIGRTASGNAAATASLLQIPGINWISVNLIRPLGQSSVDAEIDKDPIVISTLPGRQITHAGSVSVCNTNATRRPNLPEAINPEEMDESDKLLALPEAMRRGLRQVQNLPVNNPYAKILNAQFMLTFRQLAGLCLDAEFAGICKQLLEVGLRKEGMQGVQQSIATSRAAAAILRLALMELPHMRTHIDMRTLNELVDPEATELEINSHLATTGPSPALTLHIVHMTEFIGYIGGQGQELRTLKFDSGASVSCISEKALRRDIHHLRRHADWLILDRPMSLSGFASAHTLVTQALQHVELIIGEAACRHSFLVVPGLVCDYMLGQDFALAYDLRIHLVHNVASMGVPEDEWIGNPNRHTGTQLIDVHCDAVKADLAARFR